MITDALVESHVLWHCSKRTVGRMILIREKGTRASGIRSIEVDRQGIKGADTRIGMSVGMSQAHQSVVSPEAIHPSHTSSSAKESLVT